MAVTATRRPMSKTSALVALCLIGIITLGTACSPRELGGRVHGLINAERADRGIPALQWNDNAASKAQEWAESMASRRAISHSVLTDGIDGGWTSLGENVGYAGNVDQTHRGFMNSPRHAAAILNGQYKEVGIGVAERDGMFYVVEVFRG